MVRTTRLSAFLAAGFLGSVVVIACASPEAAPPPPPPSTSISDARLSSGQATSAGRSPTQRFGEGRAVAARLALGADRMVIVTTTGIAVHDENGPVRYIDRNLGQLGHVALSTSGRFFAIVDVGASVIEVWDLDDESLMFEVSLEGSPGDLHGVEFGAHEERIVVSSSQTVSTWSIDGTSSSVLIEAPLGGRLGAATSSLAKDRIVVPVFGTAAPSVQEWSESGTRSIDVGIDSDEALGAVAISADGTLVVFEVLSIGDPERDVLGFIDLERGSVIERRLASPALSGSTWTLGHDNRILVAGAAALEVNDTSGNTQARVDLTQWAPVRSISTSPESEAVVTVHEDGSLLLWDRFDDVPEVLGSTTGPPRDVDRSDGERVITVSYSGVVDRWDLREPGSATTFDDYAHGSVNGVDVSPDGRWIAAAHSGGVVDVYDATTRRIARQLDHDGRNIDSVRFSPDSTRIVTAIGERLGAGSFDDTVTLWDAATGMKLAEIGGEGEHVAGCSFFRNLVRYSFAGDLVAASSHDFTVTIYRATDLEPVVTLPPHGNTILDVGFSPDGNTVATSSEDGTLRLWDLSEQRTIAEYDAALGGYWSVVFSPDGDTLVVVGATGEVTAIAVDDGALRQTFDESAHWRSNLAFSPDGSLLVGGGKQADVIVWRTSDGTVVDRLEGHAGSVETVVVGADGGSIVSGSVDGTARRWLLDP